MAASSQFMIHEAERRFRGRVRFALTTAGLVCHPKIKLTRLLLVLSLLIGVIGPAHA
jgi:hypothetical protein